MTEQYFIYDIVEKTLSDAYTDFDDAAEAFDTDNGDLVIVMVYKGLIDDVSRYVEGADEGEEFERDEELLQQWTGKTLDDLK